jgi:hypothetical protein
MIKENILVITVFLILLSIFIYGGVLLFL